MKINIKGSIRRFRRIVVGVMSLFGLATIPVEAFVHEPQKPIDRVDEIRGLLLRADLENIGDQSKSAYIDKDSETMTVAQWPNWPNWRNWNDWNNWNNWVNWYNY